MLVAFLTCLVGLAVVLYALSRDDPLTVPGPPAPNFDVLPTPAEIARVSFPLAWPGYDPAAVEVHLDAIARAWADLLAVTPPEVVERAWRLAVLRGAGAGEATPEADAAAPTPTSALDGTDLGTDEEALRTEAALELIQAARPLPS